MTESPPAEQPAYERMGFPGLMRAARRAYAGAVHRAFADAGCDDLPRNGAYVLARVYDGAAPLTELTHQLGISKQAVSQLIDTMVMRGYLERVPDTDDRRRMLLHLTERGAAAATVAWQAASAVDEELARRVAPDGIEALRAGLIALCQISAESDAAPAGLDG